MLANEQTISDMRVTLQYELNPLFRQECKMATQNPNRLGTNCPGGSLTLGGDTTVSRLGFGAMRLCGPGVWGEPSIFRVPSAF